MGEIVLSEEKRGLNLHVNKNRQGLLGIRFRPIAKLPYGATSALACADLATPRAYSGGVAPCLCRLIVPEILKALWGQLGIPDGMLDVPMAEILLERPRVDPFIGEIKATGMPEHVGMHGEREPRRLAGRRHDMVHRPGGQWAPPFRDKQIGRPGRVTMELAQRPEFCPA